VRRFLILGLILIVTASISACSENLSPSTPKFIAEDFMMSDALNLSETGLYQDITAGTIADGIRTYTPRFELYSDSLLKKRYIFLPPHSKIIPKNLELWDYPEGTKIWKEFAAGERKIETRLLEKTNSTWKVASFVWNTEQTEAVRWAGQNGTVPVTVTLDDRTRHTVPSYSQCILCHNQKSMQQTEPGGEPVLGFTSFQLTREYITDLVRSAALEEPNIPWQRHRTYALSTSERDVFGYLHANCGHCHNPRRPDVIPGSGNPTFVLNYSLETHTSRSNTNLIKQIGKAVAGQSDPEFPLDAKLLVPGNVSRSMIFLRMNTPTNRHRMPLIGIESKDQNFLFSRLNPWIQSLSI
jgi:hypothetical protein